MLNNVQLKENWTNLDAETGPHEFSSGPVYYNTHIHIVIYALEPLIILEIETVPDQLH